MAQRTTVSKPARPLAGDQKPQHSRPSAAHKEPPATGRPAERPSAQDSLHTYRRVTNIIWQRLSPTFGMRTINAIARNVVAREVGKHPLLRHLEVSDAGLGWDELARHAQAVTPDDMHQAIDCFINEFFEALANMIGQMVVSRLFTDAELTAREEVKP